MNRLAHFGPSAACAACLRLPGAWPREPLVFSSPRCPWPARRPNSASCHKNHVALALPANGFTHTPRVLLLPPHALRRDVRGLEQRRSRFNKVNYASISTAPMPLGTIWKVPTKAADRLAGMAEVMELPRQHSARAAPTAALPPCFAPLAMGQQTTIQPTPMTCVGRALIRGSQCVGKQSACRLVLARSSHLQAIYSTSTAATGQATTVSFCLRHKLIFIGVFHQVHRQAPCRRRHPHLHRPRRLRLHARHCRPPARTSCPSKPAALMKRPSPSASMRLRRTMAPIPSNAT